MIYKKISFPWFFFYRIAKLHGIIFVIGLLGFVLIFFNSTKKIYLNSLSQQLKLIPADKNFCQKFDKSFHYISLSKGPDEICRYSDGRVNKGVDLLLKKDSLSVKYTVNYRSLRKFIFKNILTQILPLGVLLYFVFLFFFAKTAIPIKSLLAQVAKLQDSISHDEKLKLFYEKDEWSHINAALNQADQKLKNQLQVIRSENDKISTLLEAIPDEIIAIDSTSTVLFFNSSFQQTFVDSATKLEAHGKIWSFISHEEVIESFNEVIVNNISKKVSELPKQLVGGREKYFTLNITPLRDEHGSCRGAVGVFHDISEQKLIERMRVDFVANISHEIRTPLTSIKGFSQLLNSNKNKIDESFHGFIEKILHNTERMIYLFNDLLDLSVIESENKINIAPTSLPDLLKNIEDSLKAIHQDKELDISLDLESNTINVDEKLFEQVLTNLIDNACKYSASKNPKVKVTLRSQNEHTMIIISDNGPGISKEHINRIFERFYRTDSSRDRSSGGTGLGLSIVKHIVNKHNGKIWAENNENQGTSFIIEIPS